METTLRDTGAQPVAVLRRRPSLSAPSLPGFVLQAGGMVHLTGMAVYHAVRPPYTWAAEFVGEFRRVLRVCFIPLVLMAFALSFGPAGIQVSAGLDLFGAMDRLGSVYELVTVRLFGPQVVGIIIAGAAGTAICADLGARVVREEIDALAVMGVEPVKHLVVPRVLALAAAGFLFNIFALLAGVLGLVVVTLQYGADLGPVFSTFFASATPLELQASVLKSGIFGFIVAIVSTYKGLHVKGGAEGVGRAVNQTVVIAFLAIAFTDYVLTQLLLATQPSLTEVRG